MRRAAPRHPVLVGPRLPAGCIAVALAALLLPAAVAAAVVDIAWRDGRFEHRAEVAPGGFAEVCGALPAGARIDWSFDGDTALDFNIHHHVGKDVHYSARADGVRGSQGTLAVAAPEAYCWMWTNRSAAAARLTVRLSRR